MVGCRGAKHNIFVVAVLQRNRYLTFSLLPVGAGKINLIRYTHERHMCLCVIICIDLHRRLYNLGLGARTD